MRLPLYRYIFTFVACFSISAAWIFYAIVHRCPGDAGRGGAVAVALSFLMLFLRRDFGRVAFEIRVKRIPAIKQLITQLEEKAESSSSPGDAKVLNVTAQVTELSEQVKGVLDLITINAKAQPLQNAFLAGASVVGTIAWGFGDIVANKAINLLGH